MGYWIWYLIVAVLAWALRLPWLALAGALAALARRALPDALARARTAHAARELRQRTRARPGDLVTRRDLARLELALGRPLAATRLLEEAIAKGLADPEAFYLLGLARLRSGDAEGALAPLVKSVEGDERLLLGDPYFVAAEALCATRRLAEAEDALERGLAVNSSRVDAQVRLGRVRARAGDGAGARAAFRAALDTWRALPEYLRWKSLGSYAAAWWALLRTRDRARGNARSAK